MVRTLECRLHIEVENDTGRIVGIFAYLPGEPGCTDITPDLARLLERAKKKPSQRRG